MAPKANEKLGQSIGPSKEVVLAVVLITSVIALIIHFAGGPIVKGDRVKVSDQAPEIEFEMPSGKQASVRKLKGNVILLNFWASWCAPCIEEMPSLKMLEHHLKDKGFILLAFNISETKEQIRGRLGGTDMPDNLIFNFNKEYLRPYDVNAIPVSVLIDRAGIIRQTYAGPRNWLDMQTRRQIEFLLKN